MPSPRKADVARVCWVLGGLELGGNNRISHLHFEDGAERHPLYLWEREKFVNERSEFTNLGEGKTLSRIAKIRSRSLSNSTLSQGERTRTVPSLGGGCHEVTGEGNFSFAKQTVKPLVPFKRVAFTLAEVLITLGIIGVVAAMTMPTLIQNHQKQVTVNRLKKAYSTLSQMVIRTYADNGSVSDFLNSGDVVDANKTKEFFETYWLPYFNAPIVANTQFYSKDNPLSYFNGEPVSLKVSTDYPWGRILFSTQDGTIYLVSVMTWERDGSDGDLGDALYSSASQVFVDINGTKGPNTLGKDVFWFIVNFNGNIVRPYGYNRTTATINSSCSKKSDGNYCAAKIINDGWQIKDDYPW